jgi:5,6-dimethylbenzimidazole synthase
VRWRRDVRRFRTQPVDASLVEHLVALSTFSPSVGYSQPARFVRVERAERRERIIAEFERANAEAIAVYGGDRRTQYAALKLAGLREAPVHLAVFADESTGRGSGLGRRQMPETIAYSVVAAVQTLSLAARAEGIGVGWVSIVDPQRVHEILEIDDAWRLIAYLCVGYPVEEHEDRELVRVGWEHADPTSTLLFER